MNECRTSSYKLRTNHKHEKKAYISGWGEGDKVMDVFPPEYIHILLILLKLNCIYVVFCFSTTIMNNLSIESIFIMHRA